MLQELFVISRSKQPYCKYCRSISILKSVSSSQKLYYATDNWKDDDENGDDDEGGDDIPDYKQVRILYEAAEGGEVDPELSIIIMEEPDDEGEFIETIVDAGSTATPDSQYAFVDWVDEDGEEISTDAESGEITIEDAIGGETYTFNANFKKNPKKPDYPKYIPIPRVQEKAVKLNRDDHYSYIVGYPDGTFRLTQPITRDETMTMVNRVLNRLPKNISRLLDEDDMLTFPDNQPGDWYYIAVQEATNSHSYDRYETDTTGDEQWVKLIPNYDWTLLEK